MFQKPPVFHVNWPHQYSFDVMTVIGTGDDGWAGKQEELYGHIFHQEDTVADQKKTNVCSASILNRPADTCIEGWRWGKSDVPPRYTKIYGGGLSLWEADDPGDDRYGCMNTPHGRDGTLMFFNWFDARVTFAVRDSHGSAREIGRPPAGAPSSGWCWVK